MESPRLAGECLPCRQVSSVLARWLSPLLPMQAIDETRPSACPAALPRCFQKASCGTYRPVVIRY